MNKLFGPYGASDADTAKLVRDCGGNAMWFHGFNPAGFGAAESAGLHPCVEFKTFRASFEEHPELIPTGTDGKPIRYGRLVQGVCLSQSEYVEGRFTELEEGMKTYQPLGVWLDYLTYAGWFETPEPDLQESCFCEACVREFCESESVDAESPDRILSEYQEAWTNHKCSRIDRMGRRFAEIIRTHDTDCLVGIYMCPWTPEEFDGALRRIFAQDCDLLATWADIFTPLIYTEKSGRPREWSRTYLESSKNFVPDQTPVLPILDALDFPESLEALADSTVPPLGFQLFAGGKIFDDKNNRTVIAKAIEDLSSG